MPLPPVGVDICGASEEEMVFPVVAAEDLPNTTVPWVDNMTETDRDVWVKVRRCTALAGLLETAIYRNLEYWDTDGVSPVGPELFGTVLTPSMVRRAADCGFSRADCRGFIRGFVHLQVDYWPTDAFWLDSGLALEDYASLLRTACSEEADPKARCRAIPVLLRFYPDRLQEHRLQNPREYDNNKITLVWQDKLRCIMANGMEIEEFVSAARKMRRCA